MRTAESVVANSVVCRTMLPAPQRRRNQDARAAVGNTNPAVAKRLRCPETRSDRNNHCIKALWVRVENIWLPRNDFFWVDLFCLGFVMAAFLSNGKDLKV